MRQSIFVIAIVINVFGLFGCYNANEEPSAPSNPSGDAGASADSGGGGAAGSSTDGGAGQEASTDGPADGGDAQICKPNSEQDCVPKPPASCSVGRQTCGSTGTFWGLCVCSQPDSGSGGSSGSDSGGGGSGGSSGSDSGSGGGGSASCKGNCGSSQPVSGSNPPCYCDSACQSYKDCCADYATFCGSGGAGGAGGSSGSGGSGGGVTTNVTFGFTLPADIGTLKGVALYGCAPYDPVKEKCEGPWTSWCDSNSPTPSEVMIQNGLAFTCSRKLPAGKFAAINLEVEATGGGVFPANGSNQWACYGVGVNCQNQSCFKDYGTFKVDGWLISVSGGYALTNWQGGCNYVFGN